MNVLLFDGRFEALITAGVKNSTIRARRRDGKPRALEGQALSLRVWEGKPYRSKTREFAQRVVKFCFPVRVSKEGLTRLDMPEANGQLSRRMMARELGFACWRDARRWYEDAHGLPFDGVLIHFPSNEQHPPTKP